jgi:hypothetical protein
MGNGSPLAPPESFWTRLSRKVASLGPPMMGDPRIDDIGKEKKKKERKSLNVVVFSDGRKLKSQKPTESRKKRGMSLSGRQGGLRRTG